MLRIAVLVFSAWVLLAGCSGPTYSYSKPSATEVDFNQDSYACVRDSRAAGGPLILVAQVSAKREANLYRSCMEARGWTAE